MIVRGEGGRNYNACTRVNYDPKTLNRYWLRRAFFLLDHRFCAGSIHLSYIYVLLSPAVVSIFSQTQSINMRMRDYKSPNTYIVVSYLLGNKMSITERLYWYILTLETIYYSILCK